MPAVQSGLVLVTGASGFVGTYTIRALLDAGFKVRAVVRSVDKGTYLQSLFKDIELAIVPDMIKPGCYDEAAVGVDVVIHTASPLDLSNAGHPNNVIEPAVAGVTGILDSLVKAGSAKRIVTLSSILAIAPGADFVPGPITHTESEWNDISVKRCEELGEKAGGFEKYNASKVHAERAFWKFFEQKHSFDGVAIHPALIFGPPLQYSASGAVIGTFLLDFLKPGFPDADLGNEFPNFVDVRDVALGCVRALTTPDAGGERYILSDGPLFANDLAIAMAKARPDTKANKGNPDPAFRASLDAKAAVFDGSKAAKALDITYRKKDETLEETAKAVVAQLDAA